MYLNSQDLYGYGFQPRRDDGMPFEDEEQMVKAMNDPRYGRDSEYTQSVEARIEAAVRQERQSREKVMAALRAEAQKVLPFVDGEELARAYSDPRYKWDPEYQAHVYARTHAAAVAKERTAHDAAPPSQDVSTVAAGPKPFRSNTERAKAYSDPRYAADADYRQEVEQREAATQG